MNGHDDHAQEEVNPCLPGSAETTPVNADGQISQVWMRLQGEGWDEGVVKLEFFWDINSLCTTQHHIPVFLLQPEKGAALCQTSLQREEVGVRAQPTSSFQWYHSSS